MTTLTAALSWLRIALANPTVDFRDDQWEAIDQLVNQRGRVLCVQRTGWGKSMVYFVSAKLMREQGAGPTLIISPLLSLMRKQIEAANRLNLRAETINSTNSSKGECFIIGLERLHRTGDNVGFPEQVAGVVSKHRKNRTNYRIKFNESAHHSLNNQ